MCVGSTPTRGTNTNKIEGFLMNELWLRVASFLPKAKAMVLDECHKIYLLMDDEQVLRVREHGGYILVESPTL